MTRQICTLLLVLGVLVPAGWAAPPQDDPGTFNPFGIRPGESAQESFGDSRDKVTVTARALAGAVAPGGDVPVAVVFEIAPNWHLWTNKRSDLPETFATFEYAVYTTIDVAAPEDERLQPNTHWIQWPEYHSVRADVGDGPEDYASFVGRAIAYIPVTIAGDAPHGPASLEITVGFQACDDRNCVQPAETVLTVDFEVVAPDAADLMAAEPDFANFKHGVWSDIHKNVKPPDIVKFNVFNVVKFELDANTTVGFILLLLAAALGGFILNLTPCVLPVIPIKIMSLSQSAGNRARTLYLGVVMSLGIVAFWVGLGVAIAAVASFTATNQLFQFPLFTISIGLFIAIMAIGMCGVFSLRLPGAVYSVSPKLESVPGSFMFGIMVAVLSTPCTAPFMGVAAAWAALQPATITLTAFAAIGVGMAVPYLVLAAFPNLVRKMPRTGPASEVIKQVMGLLMLAAAAYFIGVGISGLLASSIAPPSRAYFWVVALFSLMAGAWILYRTIQITPSPVRRAVFGGFGVFVIAVSVYIGVRLTDKGPIDWVYYTHQRFEDAKRDGNVVVMEFTAEWCLNCKALEQTVLREPKIVEMVHSEGVTPIKVDITSKKNVEGKEMLTAAKGVTIPLLIVFDASGEEVFKGAFYTVDQVVEAITEARGARVAKK